jgi:hypothetical protein
MPIRIRRRGRSLDRRDAMENKGVKASSSTHLMASYTDRNPALRILCGSVQSLVGSGGSD